MIESRIAEPPLVVDLDGTLIHTDMLYESALQVLRDHPLELLRIPLLLTKGKAALKRHFAVHAKFDPSVLPYNTELLNWLKVECGKGRKLILCTAADRVVADTIAGHLGIFDEIIASDGVTNIAGEQKGKVLEARFGQSGFDYVGNSRVDLPVWARARQAVLANEACHLAKEVEELCAIERVFHRESRPLSTWWRMFRAHQWLKNCLLFVPLFAAHELNTIAIWVTLLWAFISFGFCASAVYITNDLFDLESDRLHPSKHSRPFASGTVPLWVGGLMAPFLLVVSLVIANLLGKPFLLCLVFYFALTLAYSWVLKRLVLIDCLTLATLYTLRIIAGAIVIGQHLSFWLLAFSVFLFLSLAFVKRYAELRVHAISGKGKISRRGYAAVDAPFIQTMGIAAGYASVLVLALYLNSDVIVRLYRLPEAVWGAVPAMLFWISWMWMQANRGKMHDDPVIFVLKDRVSLAAIAVLVAVLVVGTVGLPW